MPARGPERTRLIAEYEREFSARSLRRRRMRRWNSNAWLLWVQLLAATRRSLDLALSGLFILLFSPLLSLLYLRLKARGGRMLHLPRVGRWGVRFYQHAFSSGPLCGLPVLFNVVAGDLSFVGPRAAAPEELAASHLSASNRLNVRPGLICLWWVRSHTNIAYGTEAGADAEYVDTQSLWGDVGIALRAIPASLYGEDVAVAPDRIEILGIPIQNLTMDEAVEAILQKASAAAPSQLCFVNADCVNIAFRHPRYRSVLEECGCVLADGIGIKVAGRILNRHIRQNVNGTDLLPRLCSALESRPIGIYLLGGKPGIAADVALWINRSYPGLQVLGHRHGFFSESELPDVLAAIRSSGARILLVAFGAPKQELWIREHLLESGASLGIGVGGLFDFYSGRIPRAPAWLREMGFEWLYRFWQEPRRMWRRYFVGNFIFLARVIGDRMRSK